MKTLLINPPFYCLQGSGIPTIPLGLCYLAAALRENNFPSVIFDADCEVTPTDKGGMLVDHAHYQAMLETHPIWDRVEREIREYDPQVVGVSFSTGSYDSARRVVAAVREFNPRITVVAGGPHPTLMPGEVLQELDVDIVVRGEGEVTLVEVLEQLNTYGTLEDIAGISFKDHQGEIRHNPPRPFIADLDALPFPAFDLLKDRENYPQYPVMGSRGCPFACAYCASPEIWGRKVRFRTPANIIAEIENSIALLGNKLFRFNDDTFTLRKTRLSEICSQLKDNKKGLQWLCYGRVDKITEEMLTEMKSAGCIGIFFGVESGNLGILELMQKGITPEQVKGAFDIARRVGVTASAYFMMGFPDETKENVLDTIELMKEIQPTGFACWGIVTPFPGTELFQIAKRREIVREHPDWSDFSCHCDSMNLSNMAGDDFDEMIDRVQTETKRIARRAKLKRGLSCLVHPIRTSRILLKGRR